MKTQNEIEGRLRALLVGELDRRIAEAMKRRPYLCRFNYRHPLDDRKFVEGEPNENYNRITVAPWEPSPRTIGLCMYGQEDPENWEGNICEDDIDAQRCPLFRPIKTKAEILAEFEEQLRTPGWIDENMPGVSELAWALGVTQEAQSLPWWKRFWYRWILRIKVEPCRRGDNRLLSLLQATPPPSTPELPPGDGTNEGISP